jgi:hypothetical protein
VMKITFPARSGMSFSGLNFGIANDFVEALKYRALTDLEADTEMVMRRGSCLEMRALNRDCCR